MPCTQRVDTIGTSVSSETGNLVNQGFPPALTYGDSPVPEERS
jgi:hypothetical protein